MKRWLAYLLQGVMAFSLVAMPMPDVSCPEQADAVQGGACCCCGTACPCTKDSVCVSTAPATNDRTVGQAPSKVPARLAVAMAALGRKHLLLFVEAATFSKQEAIPPPLVIGSPPQAKLRVWLI